MGRHSGIRLETERLVLRDHVVADLDGYKKWIANPKVMHFVGFPMVQGRSEAKKVLQKIIKRAQMKHRTEWYLAVLSKTTDEYVGDVGLRLIKRGDTGGVADLGYFFLEAHQGKGYATEAARAIIQYGFDVLGLHRITAGCDAENRRSWNVMAKCGMIREAVLTKHRWRDGKWVDGLKYAIVSDE